MRRRSACCVPSVAAVLAWTLAPGAIASQEQSRFYVTGAASVLAEEGLARPAPTGAGAAAFEEVQAPGVRFVPTAARATNVPWVDSNGSRYQRGLRKANYATLPAGSAALAAAEAFAYEVEAILNPDPADVEELRQTLRFLKAQERPSLPARANIAVIDGPSPVMDSVLNLLTRRNLLYRVVRAPDPSADLTVRLGSRDFPEVAAANPHEFAALVRAKLGDEKRLVRLYGTSTVIARLTSDADRARLVLLQYAPGRRQPAVPNPQALQVRLLGRYEPAGFAAARPADPAAGLSDLRHPEGGTEFWVPDFGPVAIIDLHRRK